MFAAQAPRVSSLALVLVLVALPVASAQAEDTDRSLSPYFVVTPGAGSDGAEGEAFPLEGTQVRVAVAGVIAEVTVTQTYQNRGDAPLSARYVFPASTRAAVNGLTLTVGDRTLRAEIQERGEARRTFERAKRDGKAATLLEQDRPNVFSMSLANILPGERVHVELRYSELLVPTAGTYALVYPTVVGPRYAGAEVSRAEPTNHFIRSPYLREADTERAASFSLEGTVSAGVPLQELGSDSHPLKVDWEGPAQARFTLVGNDPGAARRDFVLRYRLIGAQIQSGLLLSEGPDENFFLLTVQPPKRVSPELMPPREYVFVLDVSGSMRGFPLETAKGLLRELARGLRPQDRFNVLLFSGGSRLMAPQSVAATPENVAAALQVVDDEEGGGGTELLPALQRALSLPHAEAASRTFVVVTDGYIGAEKALFEHVRENLGAANVFSFGIGSSVNRYLIEGLARAGMGEPFVVRKLDEAKVQARRFADYIRTPVLTRVKLEAEGFEVYDVQPKVLPDVLAERPVVVHGKWRGTPKGTLSVTGLTGKGPFHSRVDVSSVKPQVSNAPLRYLWARSRIADLSDFGPVDEEGKHEVTALGLKYSLLTQFTSFVVVHEVKRTSGAAPEVDQPLPLPEGVSEAAVGGVDAGPEPELGWLLCLALALVALTQRRRLSWARGAR